MRKTALFTLAVMMLLLAACDRTPAVQATPSPEPTEDPAAILAASASDAAAANQTHVPPDSSTDVVIVDETTYLAAKACIGQGVDALYAAIGQPIQEPYFAPSVQQDGAEDGTYQYEGFYVITLRTGDGETVQSLHVNEPVIPTEEPVEGEEAPAE